MCVYVLTDGIYVYLYILYTCAAFVLFRLLTRTAKITPMGVRATESTRRGKEKYKKKEMRRYGGGGGGDEKNVQ